MGGMGWALTANEEVEPSIFNFVTAPSIFLGQPRSLSKLKMIIQFPTYTN